MKKLAVVTATVNWEQAEACVASWWTEARSGYTTYIVGQGQDTSDWSLIHPHPHYPAWGLHLPRVVGVVPAFAIGVQKALEDGQEIIACFHDDLLIEQSNWDVEVQRVFQTCPRAGLCGFGGGKGLGSDQLYRIPYNPMQLARQNFISNMRDAEAHGTRSKAAQPVACLDGFSQIGRRQFWEGWFQDGNERHPSITPPGPWNLFRLMEYWGVIHHFYDGMLGCFAKRLGWQTWFVPVKCHHYGGRTAVADPQYAAWAATYGGDSVFWQQAHRIGYDQFRDVLPIRT